jgi:two-component system, sensor histidine kinase YesM
MDSIARDHGLNSPPAIAAPCYDLDVRRYRTVQGSIFISVSLLLTSVFVAFSLIVYDYLSVIARERFSDTLTSLSKSVLANLDAKVGEMDRLSLTLVYSRVFQDLYMRHLALPLQPSSVAQRIAKLENTEALIEICDTILGPGQSAPQLNVFDLRGEMIGAGYYSRLIQRDARLEPWFGEVMARQGERIILPPRGDPLLEDTSVIVKGKLYVSLLRKFKDDMRITEGIIEIKQYDDALFSELDSLRSSSISIFVVDESGALLYPSGGVVADGAEFLRLSKKAASQRTASGVLPGNRKRQIYSAAVSNETGWTLIIGEPAEGLSASIMQYAARIALLALSAILCSLGASYLIARRITGPIKALHAEIDGLDLGNLESVAQSSPRRGPGEVDSLRIAFHGMKQKLNESILEAVSLKAHEKEAQLTALQAQLHPHFIHNMLQTIVIMAEQNEPDEIRNLISNLTKILRYVSSTEEKQTTIGMEIEYAESYLAAMRVRFGGSLEYIIDIPEDLKTIRVPKLILQPFIENCFKYGTANRPPWRLEIRGWFSDGGWSVEISDNGPGFHPDALKALREKIASRERLGKGLPSMAISGMGILNSYERLKLFSGDAALFEIGNGENGGARISLGVKRDG